MSCYTLTIASLKGGVGKTTIALNTAFAFARRGYRTLLVDTDPQGAIGMSLAGSMREKAGLSSIVRDGASAVEACVQTRVSTLSILPVGTVHALDTDDFNDRVQRHRTLEQVRDALSATHDVLIFDTPAGLGGVTRAAIEAANGLLVPVQCEPLALRAMPQMLELLSALQQRGTKCELLGVVASMSSFRDPVVLASLEEVWSLYDKVILETSIPRDPIFLKASQAGVPVGLLSKRMPPVAAVFDRLVGELEARMSINESEPGDDSPIRLVD